MNVQHPVVFWRQKTPFLYNMNYAMTLKQAGKFMSCLPPVISRKNHSRYAKTQRLCLLRFITAITLRCLLLLRRVLSVLRREASGFFLSV